MTLSLGQLFDGKYRIARRLGEGGMGVVYEAEHVQIHRRVAIKVLHPESARNEEAASRFRREARIAGSIGHDNICEVLDVGTAPDGQQYLVMPFLRGQTLAQVAAEEGMLPVRRALDIAAQVLHGLSAAHAAGVVHRDLKPENVFLTQVADRQDFVKLLDFGVSKIIGDGHLLASSPPTRTGSLLGTPCYMAPEQARGLKDQDHRVDLYAAGVMLYEMLTARCPHQGQSVYELIVQITTAPFPVPSDIRKDLTLDVETLILRALCRDREQRYQDAMSMRADVLASCSALDQPKRPETYVPTIWVPSPLGDTAPPTAVSPMTPVEAPETGKAVESSTGRARLLVSAAILVVLMIAMAAFFLGRCESRSQASTGPDPSASAILAEASPASAEIDLAQALEAAPSE